MGVPPRPPRSPQLPRPCAAYAQGGAPSPPLRFSSYEKGGNGGERSAGLAIAWAFCVPPLGERWEERGGTPRWAICGSATLCACPSRARTRHRRRPRPLLGRGRSGRKSVVSGKSVSVRVDLGGRRIIQKKKN